MSEHLWVQESLPLYSAGGLNVADRGRVQRHVGQCRECQRTLDELGELNREMSALFAETRAASELGETMVARLRTTETTVKPQRRPSPKTFKILATCVSILMVMAIGGFLSETILKLDGDQRKESGGFKLGPDLAGGTILVYGDEKPTKGNIEEDGREKETVPTFLAGSILFRQPSSPKSTLFDGRDSSEGKKDKTVALNEVGDKKYTLDTLDDSLLTKEPKGEVASPAPQLPVIATVVPPLPPGYLPSPNPGPGAGLIMPPSPPSVSPVVPVFPSPTIVPVVQPTMPMPPQHKEGDDKKTTHASLSTAPPKFAPFGEGTIYERKGEGKDKGEAAEKGNEEEKKTPPAEPKAEQPTSQQETKPKPADAPATDVPVQVQRRIIRTGTIEFEVESFDVGVATLTKLIIETKGAFINTVNSEKRPNGKVAGSVVVRMPPEQLDEFVLKLRRDLGKFGELKVQQIGSQDVTKQYTDLESQLKASRTMEERLIQIIKEGKGVIKDLLLAEKELGIWRTKIEEIEGTLRYYANQAALSTITIQMVEKELRQAIDLLETERVSAGIEVEEVEKAYKLAIDAVTELKGRISKSELKQHAGGQFNAVIHFEIAPDQSGPMRDRLKQLGAMARLEVDRGRTSQGGPPARDTKVKRGDSQFFVSIYNLANVAARETVQIRVAVNDVPKAYKLIRAQIDKSKARIRDAQVNEQDRENVSAKIDVDVNRPEDLTVLETITGAGEVLFRQLQRRADDANVTDAKVRIDLQLVNAANIPARETVTMRIAVPDVAKAFAELRDRLAKAKARFINSQMQEQDRLNVTGQIDLDVPRPDDAAMLQLLIDSGEVLSRNVVRRTEVANVTDTKVQFNIALVSSANIAARELVTLRVAVTDVPKAFQQLRDEISKSKAKARIVAQVQEQDRQNVFASIDFDVLRPEHTDLIQKLGSAGEVITRHVQRQADNPNLTDTKVFIRLELWNVDKVPARDSVDLQVAAVDVPKVFQELRDQIVKAKAKIHTDKLNENDRRNVHAILEFDVQKPANEQILKMLTEAGEVMTRQAQRRADNESALDSKVAFRLHLVNALTIPARERVLLQVAVADVSKAYAQIRTELSKSKTYVDQSSINETDRQNTRAHLEFAARKPEDARLLSVLNDLGEVLTRKEEPNASGENSTDANVAFLVDLVSAAGIKPRETVTVKLETENVIEKLEQINAQVLTTQGRVSNPKVHHTENGVIVAVVTYDVPLSALQAIRGKIQASGKILEQNATQDPTAPDGKLALARIQLTMATSSPIVGRDQGFRSGFSSGLSMSVRGLAVSLQFLVVGLLFVVPWMALLYIGYWFVRRMWPSGKEIPATPTAPTSAAGE